MEDKSDQFIRAVQCYREPAIVVATERQLNDLVRFCTVLGKGSIMTIDPTFSLGDFDVTVITYRHTMLSSRQSKQPPGMIGPVMVHYRKTFSSYLFFGTSLLGLRRELLKVKCFGTDGEQALVDAFKHTFSNSFHLTCTLHVRRNTKAKLQELGISGGPKLAILDDLFGKTEGSTYSEGLIDVSSCKMYDQVFDSLVNKWMKLGISSSALNKFTSWFTTYKSSVVKTSMLTSIRQKCGLGTPPAAFTTNASESINAVLKKKVDYKRNELPRFFKELIEEQDAEIQKAIISRGKYVLKPEYRKFKKTEQEWFVKMKEADRVHHLQRFACYKIADTTTTSSSCSSQIAIESVCTSSTSSVDFSQVVRDSDNDSDCRFSHSEDVEEHYGLTPSQASYSSSKRTSDDFFITSPKRAKRKLFPTTHLSISVDEVSKQVAVPRLVLEGMWTKASKLLTTTGAIMKAPGLDPKAHTVLSSSGNPPHLVTLRKNGQYICDKTCGNWNSTRVCSHTLAVAEVNGDLSDFVSWLVKSKKQPSLTKPLITGMPDGRGNKGGKSSQRKKKTVPPKMRTPITSLLPMVHVQASRDESVQYSVGPSSIPTCPPPLVHFSPQSTSPSLSEPFILCFVIGNISVCYGCRQKYPKPASPPHDICVKHKEWREYFPPGSSTSSSRYGNVYYHCNLPCIRAKCPFFEPSMLQIPAQIAAQLLPIHTEYLSTYMDRGSNT